MYYTLIQYFVFIILAIMSLYYLGNSKIYFLKDPFDKRRSFMVGNLQYLLLFIFSTAIISCGGELMAYRLLTAIIITSFMIFYHGKVIFSLTHFFYLLYLAWLILEIYLSPVKSWGFRVFLKYSYPFIIMMAASIVPASSLFYAKVQQILLRLSLFGVLWFLVLSQIPVVSSLLSSVLYWGTAILDFFPVALTIALLKFSNMKQWKYLITVAVLCLTSIITVNRTGLLCTSLTIVVFALLRYKARSIPYVVLGIGILVGTILYVPAFRDKMFKKQMSKEDIIENRENMSIDDVNTNGREAMWQWSMVNFYKEKELTGSGLGVLQEAFQNKKTPFQIPVVHNDYVQILCDTGLIGLVLYILTFLSLIIHCIWIYLTSRYHPIVRDAAFIAGVSLIGMLSTLYTDNVVNYSLMTLSFPFALYGMMLGLKKQYSNFPVLS